MNPCKILEEICHLAVFFKVPKNSVNLVFAFIKGASAVTILSAILIKACWPSTPTASNF
jgi:hypothetical protein